MEPLVSPQQKKIIGELVDLLVVNHGVLPVNKNYWDLGDAEFAELSRQAFKYYKMIYASVDPLDIDINETNRGISIQPGNSESRACIGCGQPLADYSVPVCDTCRGKLKAEYDVLKSLLR
jgi:hypothetical protein